MLRVWLLILLLTLLAIVVSAQKEMQSSELPVPSDQWATRKIIPPKLIQGERADYPDDARIKGIDGLCSMSMVVGIQGDPESIRILHCTDPSFEESSLDAIKQYRFNAATTQDGKAIPVLVTLVLQYHISQYVLSLKLISGWLPDRRLALDHRMSRAGLDREVGTLIHYGFIPLGGGASEPGPEGIYPFTRNVTGPRLISFFDERYGRTAFVHEGNSACDVMLTIDVKGRASNPQVTHCERSELEKPVVESLLKSNYKPGFVHGKEVPMRALMHLNYGDIQSAEPISLK
ncbi:MAG TPA: energy transducer TonB [Terracidiphilus sp.]|jgi:hypothetical protein|nr:energy transducer TonB [Terracidiphilus sp.]